MPGPPVARISFTSFTPISSWQPAMDAMLRQPTHPLGAPALSAASATIFAARKVQQRALGWGEKTMALPDFKAISDL